MDSDYSNDEQDVSDVELDDATHKHLVNNVLNLNYKQHVKKSTRTEPSLHVSEFDLVKTGKNVHVGDLASVLQRRGKQAQIGAQLKRAEQKLSTLPKPLEKPAAERIHRTVAYKKTQNELGKWDPIVSSVRSATHTAFPLHSDSKLDEKVESKADWGYKTALQKELAAVAPKEEVFEVEEDEFPMTMEEMIEKRREAARIRAHESYKIAKARRQNKIKSKKYHRLQKKEKMKQQMKEFELLQKTNPDAALEKLEEIEKARAEERMSLRHKSTGQWAKSKLVRAKYDKETRQVLAQQLSLSRDLTQKLKKGESDSENEETPETEQAKIKSNPNNPWLNGNIKVSKEVDDFVSGYRKYWEQQNGVDQSEKVESKTAKKDATIQENLAVDADSGDDDDITEFTKALEETKTKIVTKRKALDKASSKREKQVKLKRKRVDSTSEWDVSDAVDVNSNKQSDNASFDLDHEFNKIDTKLRKKVEQKYKALKGPDNKKSSKSTKSKNTPKKDKPSQLELLALPKENLRPVIDEELDESAHRGKQRDEQVLKAFNLIPNDDEEENVPAEKAPQQEEIDPSKFMNMKPTKLNTAIPDLLAFEDNEETDQRGVISEAFQDDDVVDNFQKEKQDDIDANKPKDVNLYLPGWGAWGGKDIKTNSRKKKRFIVKFPEKMKRKDSNKGNLILNENSNSKVRAHLVSEVPFPFKNVKDYEASIRAPIGSTFVPETAFRRLTKPAVTTKMGTVIEPMNDEILIKKKRK